jgi:hypothetical protein
VFSQESRRDDDQHQTGRLGMFVVPPERAEDHLDRLSKTICGIIECQSCKIESLYLLKIRFKANNLGSILRSVEKHPLDLEISGFIGTEGIIVKT